jgi:hypothetical protein
MLQGLRDWLHARRALDAVDGLDDRTVAELGFDRGAMKGFARMPADTSDRVERMAAIHGLDEATLKGNRGEYIGFIEACGHCGARRLCSETLDAGNARPEDCGFCPNAPDYARKAAAPVR